MKQSTGCGQHHRHSYGYHYASKLPPAPQPTASTPAQCRFLGGPLDSPWPHGGGSAAVESGAEGGRRRGGGAWMPSVVLCVRMRSAVPVGRRTDTAHAFVCILISGQESCACAWFCAQCGLRARGGLSLARGSRLPPSCVGTGLRKKRSQTQKESVRSCVSGFSSLQRSCWQLWYHSAQLWFRVEELGQP